MSIPMPIGRVSSADELSLFSNTAVRPFSPGSNVVFRSHSPTYRKLREENAKLAEENKRLMEDFKSRGRSFSIEEVPSAASSDDGEERDVKPSCCISCCQKVSAIGSGALKLAEDCLLATGRNASADQYTILTWGIIEGYRWR